MWSYFIWISPQFYSGSQHSRHIAQFKSGNPYASTRAFDADAYADVCAHDGGGGNGLET
jgi:hypothetical protein